MGSKNNVVDAYRLEQRLIRKFNITAITIAGKIENYEFRSMVSKLLAMKVLYLPIFAYCDLSNTVG